MVLSADDGAAESVAAGTAIVTPRASKSTKHITD